MKRKRHHPHAPAKAAAPGPAPAPAPAAAPSSARVLKAAVAGVEPAEPVVHTTFRTPIWLVGLLGLLMFWAQMYVDRNGGELSELVFLPGQTIADLENNKPKSEAGDLFVKGRLLYKRNCDSCHQPNGRGDAARSIPPLAESEWVLADGPNRIVRIVLSGLNGPMKVKGVDYGATAMLPWRESMTDEDIAAVLTFVRGNAEWGNKAGPVLPAQVKTIRAATESRGITAWTEPELLAIPVKD
jgi:mono/diheme cytochrome c family protein